MFLPVRAEKVSAFLVGMGRMHHCIITTREHLLFLFDFFQQHLNFSPHTILLYLQVYGPNR